MLCGEQPDSYSPRVPPSALIGGRFQIEREVGTGGMGVIYRARDLQVGSLVALKVLRLTGKNDASRFSREASLLAQISHPGVVRYLAHGITENEEHYLAMEWLNGGTLAARLAKRGLTLRESVRMLGAVAEALAAVHAHGVVHRDITPRNLMFEAVDSDRIKVVDFGIARRGENLDLTKAGVVIGSPGYMSPEQARGEQVLDARADVFSLGCILYQCLTGRPPFVGDPVAVRIKVLMGDPVGVRELNGEVSIQLEELVRRMLAKDPALRPSSAAVIAAELGKLLESNSSTVWPSAPQFQTAATMLLSGGNHEQEREPQPHRFLILLGADQDAANDAALAALATSHGGRMEPLGEFARIVSLDIPAWVPAAAERVLSLAKKLRTQASNAPMALVAAGSRQGDHEQTIDRASTLLGREAVDSVFGELATDRPRGQLIRLDEAARSLLAGSGDVIETPVGAYLCVR